MRMSQVFWKFIIDNEILTINKYNSVISDLGVKSLKQDQIYS